jgi:Arc/MetJ-type ribon-helix-helix transcriptional regulator
MGKVQTATVQIDVPVRLLTEMQTLVEAGWFRDLDELMVNALRRYVESHRAKLMERFIREDVEWGLSRQPSP